MISKRQFSGKRVRLGDVCEICSGGTPKRTIKEYWENGDIPWVKISDISEKYVATTEESITKAGLKNSSAKLLEPGTLLFSIFASIGAVGVLNIPAATNQAIAGLKIHQEEIDRDYLFHYLKSQESITKSSGRGAAQNNINLTILRNMEVPVPELNTQREIALEFESIELQIKSNERQISKLDSLVKSRFVETLDKHGKSKVPLGSLVKVMHIGPFGSALKNDAFVPQSKAACVVYEQKHAISKSIDCNWRYVDEAKRTELKRFEAGPGTILVSCRGTLGKVYRLPDTAPIGIIHPSLMKIEIDDSRVDGVYFVSLLERLFAEEAARAKGSGVKMAIKAKELSRIEVKTPSLKVQREYATFVTQVDKLKFDLGICLFILKEGIFRLSG